MNLDGDVTTGLVGADASWERVLAGVLVSRSNGSGSYRLDPHKGDDRGDVESALTGIFPYARIGLTERISMWGAAGLGSGELTLSPEAGRPIETDISMRMGALGVKGRVLDGSGPSGLGLKVRSDAMWVGTSSERTDELVATQGEVSRLRFSVQGERKFQVGEAMVTPLGEVGLRVDRGDAETGAGLELGAGVRYVAGRLAIEGRVRGSALHRDTDFNEWGASGSLRFTPAATGRGLTLSIAPAWGQAASQGDRLWAARDASAFEPWANFQASRRVKAELSYGFAALRDRGVVTPYAGLLLSEDRHRTYRAGARWKVASHVFFDLEGALEEHAAGPRSASIAFGANLRW